MWEGLADFAADRGYSWHDRDAKRVLERAGLEPFLHPNEVRPEHEAFFRRLFLRDVAADPVWYGGVLARRAVATLTLSKLAPWGPRDGLSVSEPIFYYKYTIPADWFGLHDWRREAPISVFWALGLAYVGWWLASRGRAGSAPHRLRRFGLLLLVLTCGCLGLPVLVTTAGALETQMMVFVYFLAAGFLAQEVARGIWSRMPGRSAAR
jgi:hypothetical protein